MTLPRKLLPRFNGDRSDVFSAAFVSPTMLLVGVSLSELDNSPPRRCCDGVTGGCGADTTRPAPPLPRRTTTCPAPDDTPAAVLDADSVPSRTGVRADMNFATSRGGTPGDTQLSVLSNSSRPSPDCDASRL